MNFLLILLIFNVYSHSFDLTAIRKAIKNRTPFNNVNTEPHELQDLYDISWYVIGETKSFKSNTPKKITIWNKNYVVWRNNYNFHACDNICPHRVPSFAAGKVCIHNIICPYHGYEFTSQDN